MEIPLTKGRVAVIDDADWDLIKLHKWHASKRPSGVDAYVAATNIVNSEGKKRLLLMHRLIMGRPEGSEVDHVNRNPLDNRRCNLRIATRRQNAMNVCQEPGQDYKGVSRVSNGRGKPWRARIKADGMQIHLGTFDTKEEAALAYNAAARSHYGEFAFINVVYPHVPPHYYSTEGSSDRASQGDKTR